MKKKYKLIGIYGKVKTAAGHDRKTYIHKYHCVGCGEQKTFTNSSRIYFHSRTCIACHSRAMSSKPVSLRHFSADNVENFPSITAFCQQHPELGENAKNHFSQVLNGKKMHYKGWMRADNLVKIDLNKVKCNICLKDSIENNP